MPALKNSLIVGVSATVIATVLGTLAALGIWRARFPAQALVLAILISPMVVPVIIVAVGVYFAFAPLGLTDGYVGLILAHTTLGVPFVVITVLATLSGFDRTLIRAAESLGASQITTFRRVTLPLIVPAFFAGLGVVFIRSMTAISATIFLISVSWTLITVKILDNMTELSLGPAAAFSVFVVVVVYAVVAMVGWLLRRLRAPGAAPVASLLGGG